MAKLTEKQQRFVEEYLVDLNATQAAIRAGYSVKTADVQGSRMLRNVKVQSAIGEAMALRSRRTGINQDRVVLELAKIAFVNITDIVESSGEIKEDARPEDLACVESIKHKSFSGYYYRHGNIYIHLVIPHSKMFSEHFKCFQF